MADEGIEEKKWTIQSCWFFEIWNSFIFKGKTIGCNQNGRQAVFLQQIGQSVLMKCTDASDYVQIKNIREIGSLSDS